jgi:mono/diheme cytochrome c family protein
VWVVGERSSEVLKVLVAGDHLEPTVKLVGGARGYRGVAVVDGGVSVLDLDGVVRFLGKAGDKPPPYIELPVGALAFGLRAAGGVTASMSVGEHKLVLQRGPQRAELRNDGPFFGFALRAVGDDVVVAAGHVEDHPLDRTMGSFAFIDSFVRVVRWKRDGTVEPLALVNLSEHGVVTPKALAFIDDDTVAVAAAGSAALALVHLSAAAPRIEVREWPPGAAALVADGGALFAASPLLDALIVDGRVVPVAHAPRDAASRLGEALVFTNIMAPRQKSDGRLSRFTCEACHFEGGVDGRTHRTGRGDIVATTRPLYGLANNTPLFSRALDPDLSEMVHAEFRVANANSELDPWFALTPKDAPWLSALGVTTTQSPADLRRALISFLFDFTPPANPNVLGKRALDERELRGAALFQQHCARCHAPRLVGGAEHSAVAFERWPELILSEPGAIVWSMPRRMRTGVEPYVHPEGARPSSLRRLSMKRPYFTNGSAGTLDDVLAAIRFDGAEVMHAGGTGAALDAASREALRAFLDLL